MSATINDDATNSVSNQTGEFGSHVPRAQPQTTHGHQPGQQVGKDAIPESHIQVLPSNSAPSDRTFAPQTSQSSVPGQALNSAASSRSADGMGSTDASATLTGASSADVHQGYAHPGQGQTSAETHAANEQAQGLQGVGASGAGHFDQQGSTGKRVP